MENIRNMFRTLWEFICYLFHIFVFILGLTIYTFLLFCTLSHISKKMNR